MRRLLPLLLALAVAAPLAAITTGAGVQDRFAAAAVGDSDVDLIAHPESVFTVDSAPMQLARQIAHDHWGVDVCQGKVALSWAPLDDDVNAQSSWSNTTSAYDNPDINGDCAVTFNPRAEFDWPKFCTVMVHEIGHLAGKQHSQNPADVMAAYYADPLPACVSASATAGFPPPAATPAPTTAKPRAVAASTKPKAKKTVKRKTAKKRTTRKHRRALRWHRSARLS